MTREQVRQCSVGDIISFQYKRGEVKGEVVFISKTSVIVRLHKDYQGRNEYWGKGEKKQCTINEIYES